MKKNHLVGQLATLDQDLERYIASVPDPFRAMRGKQFGPDEIAEIAVSYSPPLKVDPLDEMKRLIDTISVSPIEIQDTIAAQLSSDRAKYFSELWKDVLDKLDESRPGLANFLSHAFGFNPAVLIEPIRRMQRFIRQLADPLEKEEELPGNVNGPVRAQMEMSDAIKGDTPQSVAAIARRMAAALRELPDTMQKILVEDPSPIPDDARRRLVFPVSVEESEAFLRHIGRNWTLDKERRLRRELSDAKRHADSLPNRMAYWDERRRYNEEPQAYQREVGPAIRQECVKVAVILEEWAIDIESQSTLLADKSEDKRRVEPAARIKPDATGMSGEAREKKSPKEPRPSKARLKDPIPVVRITEVIGRAAGRSDKLAEKMKTRNYRIVKIANKLHCERADALAMFPNAAHKEKIKGI